MKLIPDASGALYIPNAGGPNLLTVDRLTEYSAILQECAGRNDISSIVFTSTSEGFFCAGADMRELATFSAEQSLPFSRLGQQLFQRMETCSQLTIALVDGWCMGGGLDLLLACDLVLVTAESRFAHPGARIGIITGFGGTVRLPEAAGLPTARRMMFTGRRLTAHEARQAGFVTEIVPESSLHTRARELSATYRAWPAQVRHQIKATIIGSSGQR